MKQVTVVIPCRNEQLYIEECIKAIYSCELPEDFFINVYVVDGIPIDNGGGGQALQSGPSNSNRAIDINAEDIESMSVLKGAAATVLYGSRAASGVILITTI